MSKMKLRFFIEAEIDINPDNYLYDDAESIIQTDLEGISEDPFLVLEGLNAKWTINASYDGYAGTVDENDNISVWEEVVKTE